MVYIHLISAPDQLGRKQMYHYIREAKSLELVSKELNHLAAILHVYAGGLIFMK